MCVSESLNLKSKRDILINTLFRQQKLKEEGVRIERNGENCMEIALRAIKKKRKCLGIFLKRYRGGRMK